MFFLTLPGTPLTSPHGIAHLLIVGLLVLAGIVAVAAVAIAGAAIPNELGAVVLLGIGYLVGANATAPKYPYPPE